MENTFIDSVGIVDGASTATYLAPAFRAYGIRCVHITSSPLLPERLVVQVNHADYARSIVHHGDIARTGDAIKDMNLAAIIPGTDPGVELASDLSEYLGLPYRNPAALAPARRHKYAQLEAMRRAGLRVPAYHVSRSIEDIVGWVKTYGRLPVVIKPTRGSGVKGVKICRTTEEVHAAALAVLSTVSSYEEVQDEVLVESFLEGQEYIVDSVSFGGAHKVINVWEVERDRRSSPRLEKMVIVDHTQPEFEPIVSYAKSVLDAAGLYYGPSHVELIDTNDGPVIVELNSRLHGSLDPRLSSAVMGDNQVLATAEAFAVPARFLKTMREKPPFTGYSAHLLLCSPGEGQMLRDFTWDKLKRLSSFVGVNKWAKKGDMLKETVDLRSALGMVALSAPERDELMQDCRTIRSIEAEFFSTAECFARRSAIRIAP